MTHYQALLYTKQKEPICISTMPKISLIGAPTSVKQGVSKVAPTAGHTVGIYSVYWGTLVPDDDFGKMTIH